MRTPRRLVLLSAAMIAAVVVAYAGLRNPTPDMAGLAGRPTSIGEISRPDPLEDSWRHILEKEPVSLSDLSEALNRPLFSESRRPPAPAVVERTTEPKPPPGVGASLSGVVVSGAGQMALLSPNDGGKVRRLSVGEAYEGWTVTEIGPDFVILESAAGIETLHLRYRRRDRE